VDLIHVLNLGHSLLRNVGFLLDNLPHRIQAGLIACTLGNNSVALPYFGVDRTHRATTDSKTKQNQNTQNNNNSQQFTGHLKLLWLEKLFSVVVQFNSTLHHRRHNRRLLPHNHIPQGSSHTSGGLLRTPPFLQEK
jgi:hypothetical protein